jgi:UV DNA damage repair endonuclease
MVSYHYVKFYVSIIIHLEVININARNFNFPIGFYVKLSSAVAAILVGGMKCRTQFWKGTTKGSFQESLVEIGSVVSEEKILLKFHPPFFLFFAWWHLGWK